MVLDDSPRSKSTTSFSLPRHVAIWRRNTGLGPSMLVVAQIWIAFWLLAGLGTVVFGVVLAAHDYYLDQALVETTGKILDARSDLDVVCEPRLSLGGRERLTIRGHDALLVSYSIANQEHKRWLDLDPGKPSAAYRLDSVHPLFYHPVYPTIVRLERPIAANTFRSCLTFATPFLLIALVSQITLRRFTRSRRSSPRRD
jgi:hypothetical protein